MSLDVTQLMTNTAGSFLVGLALGYFIRISIKILMIIFGSFTAILLVLMNNGVISINFDKLGELIGKAITSLNSLLATVPTIGLPFTAGLLIGMKLGVRRTGRKTPESFI